MHSIVVVGHPASGYADVWAALRLRGVAAALPSRRDGILPEDITSTLCKAYRRPDVDLITDEADFSQVTPDSIWQNMALDLILGNIDQPVWGWTDPRTILAADYWVTSIPQLTLVLVYDEPHSVLRQNNIALPGRNNSLAGDHDLGEKLDNWVAFNSALMKLHFKHPDRTILVNARETLRHTDQCIQELQKLLGTSFVAARDGSALHPSFELANHQKEGILSALKEPGDSFEGFRVSPNEVADAMHCSLTENYLLEGIIDENSSITELYDELQSVASLPLDAPQNEGRKGGAVTAWKALSRQRGFNYTVIKSLFDITKRSNDEIVRIKRHHKSILEAPHLNGAENQLILTQLHEAQEEIELLTTSYESIVSEKNERIDQLKSVRFGKEKRIDQLKTMLDSTRGELEAQAKDPVDLSTVPGRRMLRVAAMRLLRRFTRPKIFSRSDAAAELDSNKDGNPPQVS